jgi:hypothetical protein
MKVFALFENGPVSELKIGSYKPYDKPISVYVLNQDSPQLQASCTKATHSAYHILRNKKILKGDERYCASFEFLGNNLDYNVLGESAGLAFLLKFTAELYQRKSKQDIHFSIAATGAISEHTADAKVEKVAGINAKIKAAASTLCKGDKILCPKENEDEIDDKIRKELLAKQIDIIPVATAEEAIDVIIGSHNGNHKPKNYIPLFILILLLAIAGYNFIIKDFYKIPTFQTLSFHYFNPRHGQLNLLEDNNYGFVLYSGDEYQFEIKPDMKCYLYIYQHDSSDKLFCLFPKYGTITNPLKPGNVYWIPSKDGKFQVDETIGEEKFYFIAAIRQLNNLEDKIKTQQISNIKHTFYKEFTFLHK